MIKRIVISFFLVASSVSAEEDALSIETKLPTNFELAFPNESGIRPEVSAFKVISFVPMSNELGERYAVITITNTANGNRTLNHNHLIALVADGNRINPQEISQRFLAGETLSIVVNFGTSKFPLLTVYSRTER